VTVRELLDILAVDSLREYFNNAKVAEPKPLSKEHPTFVTGVMLAEDYLIH